MAASSAALRIGVIALMLALAGGLLFQHRIARVVLEQLTYVRHLPESGFVEKDVAYVLGGTTESLNAKLRVAAQLFRARRVARLLVLSQPSIMEFSPSLGRNLTANEWMIESARSLGVEVGALEFVPIEDGFFGTWSEARSLARWVRERGYRRLVLVTSPFHSRRVWESFSHTVEQPDSRLFLYASDEWAGLRQLLTEYGKLTVYRLALF